MLYTKPSFTVPATEGNLKTLQRVCAIHGHMEPDARGKCLRCGFRLRYPIEDYS